MLGATVVVLVLAAAGCGGGGVDEADATSTTVEPSTTSEPTSPPTTVDEEQAVLAAYQGYWDTWLAANDPPDPDFPGLAAVRTEQVLVQTREAIRARAATGQVIRVPDGSSYEHRPSVLSITEEAAEVADCAIDGAVLLGAVDGFVLDDTVVTRKLRSTLVRSGGAWLVSAVATEAEWEGVAGCAA